MSSGRYVMSWRVSCLHVESVYIVESARRVGLHRRVGAIEHSG